MPIEINLPKIKSSKTPREIIAADFIKSLNGEIPIRGGWGYTKKDACIIDKNDPSVDPELPFDHAEWESIFIEKRIYQEMIISRPDGKKFCCITWNFKKQYFIRDFPISGVRTFDCHQFEITAFFEQDWKELNLKRKNSDFDILEYEKKRQEKMVRLIREFWFEITSCCHGELRPPTKLEMEEYLAAENEIDDEPA
jgi:hypothetical protein